MKSFQDKKLNFTNILADPYDYACKILKQTKTQKSVLNGKKSHAQIIKLGLWSLIFMQNQLITMYTKCNSPQYARQVFDKMPQKRNSVTWNALLAGYIHCGNCVEAIQVFANLHRQCIELDRYNLCSTMRACTLLEDHVHAEQVHALIVKIGHGSNNFVGSSLVGFYSKCGEFHDASCAFREIMNPDMVSCNSILSGLVESGDNEEAVKLFDKMPERNLVSYTALLVGFSQCGKYENALRIFSEILVLGLEPDGFTFSSAVGACCGLALLNQGLQVHTHCVKNGVVEDIFVGTALVDMYSKCGTMEYASKVFEEMPTKNVISWTSMIVGFAQNGVCHSAIGMFEEMQRAGQKPNHVTFLGVLLACCHLGFVEEGLGYLDSMSRFGILPRFEHCTCVVDMLGRAGHLREAVGFLCGLQGCGGDDSILWRILLSTCRLHGDVELGKQISGILIKKDPDDASCYVLLSHIYAGGNKWEDVSKVRNMLRSSKSKKEPGCSWIQIKNNVHCFVSGDLTHEF